jgi:hypothetical protein
MNISLQRASGLATAVCAALALASAPAHADQVWDWSYAGNGVTASGQWATAGNSASTPQDLEWITGTYSDGHITDGTITGLVAPGTDPLWFYDNKFGGNPVVSNAGVLFDVNNGESHVNLFTDSGSLINGTWHNGNYEMTTLTMSSLTVTAVPEPASGALLLAGLGMLAFTARRRAAGNSASR